MTRLRLVGRDTESRRIDDLLACLPAPGGARILRGDPGSNAKHYRSAALTEVKDYEGRAHLMPAQEGWEEIADDALDWAIANARQASPA